MIGYTFSLSAEITNNNNNNNNNNKSHFSYKSLANYQIILKIYVQLFYGGTPLSTCLCGTFRLFNALLQADSAVF
jgi:hypothetical protein